MEHISSAHTSLSSGSARRQFQSCDHCRNRRRRCDAGARGVDPYSTLNPHNPRACTACAKSGRVCTFDWLTQRKQPRAWVEDQNGRRPVFAREKRRTLAAGDRSRDALATGGLSASSSFSDDNQNSSDYHESKEADSYQRQDHYLKSSPIPSTAYGAPWAVPGLDWSAALCQANDTNTTWSFCGNGNQEPADSSHLDGNGINVLIEEGAANHSIAYDPLASTTICLTSATSLPTTALNLADDGLAVHSNKLSIADSLVTIYLLNLEAVLSSWSTAITCPYVSNNSELASSTVHSITTFYERANRMDGSIARLGLAKIASSANAHRAMESQVLNKVILAFASQCDSASAPRHKVSPNPFARTLQAIMQKTLWHDAHKALQKVADRAGSFRIIFARLIFSFIQKPLDTESPAADQSGTRSQYDRSSPDWTSQLHEDVCASIVTDPDCSTQMEQALRDLLCLRRRLYMELRAIVKMGRPLTSDQQYFLTDFNTLFWLSVMCDTTASAISGRPLVISDDDCAIESICPELLSTPLSKDMSQGSPAEMLSSSDGWKKPASVWSSILVKEMDANEHLALPYGNNEPADIIKEAIPLKVLFFRHIGTLQTLIDRMAPEKRLEKAIQDALLVCKQWQAKYGEFMDGLAEGYTTMCSYLRSWHTILAAHWHYGVMLFAEKMQFVRSVRLNGNLRHGEEQLAYTPTNMALSSAMQVIKLAYFCLGASRTSTISTDPGQSQLAMLSEPWCEIMVRSLSMAAEVLLKSDLSNVWHLIEQHVQSPQDGLLACIEVLEELGEHRYKSAGRIAQLLRNALDSMS